MGEQLGRGECVRLDGMRRQGKVADDELCKVLLTIQDEEVEHTNAVVQQEQDARTLWTQSSETDKASSKSSDTVLQGMVRELRDLIKRAITIENKGLPLLTREFWDLQNLT